MKHSTTRKFAAILVAATVTTMTAATAQESRVEPLPWLPDVRAAVRACMADQSRLCADVAPGNGRIIRCLARQPDRLSTACAAAMQRASDALMAAGAAVRPGLISQ